MKTRHLNVDKQHKVNQRHIYELLIKAFLGRSISVTNFVPRILPPFILQHLVTHRQFDRSLPRQNTFNLRGFLLYRKNTVFLVHKV